MMSYLERSAGLYRHAGHIICGIGERMFAVTVSDAVIEGWEETMKALRYVDTAIDGEHDSRKRETLGIAAIDFLSGKRDSFNWADDTLLNESVYGLKDALANFPEENRLRFIKTLDRLRRVSERVKSTDKRSEYARLTRLEGQLTSRLLTTLVPVEDYATKENILHFFKYVKKLGRFANSVDSFIDFSRDSQKGEVLVEPSLMNRWELVRSNVIDLFALIVNVNPIVALDLLASLRATYQSYSTRPSKC